MLAMGLPLRPVNTPLAGAPDFGWDFAGWPVHTTVTTSATTRSEVGTIIPPALCRCDGHPLHLRARLRAIIPRGQENGAHPRLVRPRPPAALQQPAGPHPATNGDTRLGFSLTAGWTDFFGSPNNL